MKSTNLKNSFASTSHADFAARYHDAYAWFESFGFNVAATRLRQYKDIVDELADHYRKGSLATAEFRKSFSEQVNAIREISEITRIHTGLATLYDSSLGAKLQKVLSGSAGRSNPNSFDPSRDTAFELLMASRLHSSGYSVDFSSDADLVVLVEQREVFVECKRLKSRQKMHKRINEGLRQLHRRYVSSTDPNSSRGILALSISDLVNPHHGILVADSGNDLSATLSEEIDKFIRSEKQLWQQGRDARTIGVLIELSTIGISKSPHMVNNCTQVGVNNSCPVNTPEFSLLLKMSKDMARTET